jgi:hypothetical protein
MGWVLVDTVLRCGIRAGTYDARTRALLFRLCKALSIAIKTFVAYEDGLAVTQQL